MRSRPWNRLPVTALAACGALLLLPASGNAAQVFGSGLFNQPTENGCRNLIEPCTVAAFVELPAEGQLTSAGAPTDGVITSFRVRAVVQQPTQATLRTAAINEIARAEAMGTAPAIAPGSTVTLQVAEADAPPQQFAVRVPVKKGEHLALEGSGLIDTHASSGDPLSYAFSPALAPGVATKSSQSAEELLVQATVEPDADGDGFGDESQDKCTTQKTAGAPCDTTSPAISGLKVKKGKAFYRLSEPATVSLFLEKKVKRRFKRFGRPFAGTGNPGPNTVTLPARSKLKFGVYRLRMTAADPVGNTRVAAIRFAGIVSHLSR